MTVYHDRCDNCGQEVGIGHVCDSSASTPSPEARFVSRVRQIVLGYEDTEAAVTEAVRQYDAARASQPPAVTEGLGVEWAKRMASALYRGHDYTVTPEDILEAARLSAERATYTEVERLDRPGNRADGNQDAGGIPRGPWDVTRKRWQEPER